MITRRPNSTRARHAFSCALLAGVCLLFVGCHSAPPALSFTQVPEGSRGGPDTKGVFAGRVAHARAGDRIVIYALSGDRWWVQPMAVNPFTSMQSDGTWSAEIHLGSKYAAVLVHGDYSAQSVRGDLPAIEGKVRAVEVADASAITDPPPAKQIHFSGYDWEVRDTTSNIGGKTHRYALDNVWLDEHGAMHLRAVRSGSEWVCAEAHTVRTLGYGTYRFDVRDTGQLEPAAMLSLDTWTDGADTQNHHELDIHVSRWGVPGSKNGEYVVQPYYVPSNVYRFDIPPGPMTASFHWSPNSAMFATASPSGKPVAAWNFTTGVPPSGPEKTHVSVCEYAYGKVSLEHETEVVIDRFQFLP